MYLSKTQNLEDAITKEFLNEHPKISAGTISTNDMIPFIRAYNAYGDDALNINITLKYKHLTEDSMQSYYAADILFVKKTNRRYFMYITNNKDESKGQVFYNMPIDAKTGWCGHEDGHLMDYEEKSKRQILGFTLAYSFNWLLSKIPEIILKIGKKRVTIEPGIKYLKRIEQNINMRAIKAGLEHELASGIDYTIDISKIPKRIKKRYSQIYKAIN